MAEPGDPTETETESPGPPADAAPSEPAHSDFDDAIGFASPAHLEGRPAAPAPGAGPLPSEPDTRDVSAPGIPVAPVPPPEPAAVRPEPRVEAEPLPAWARETPRPASRAGFGNREAERPAEVEGNAGLMATYALILFAVPTLGVSAVIALMAVTGRTGPTEPVAASHFVFQQRTLWAGAVAALLGAILITVGLGVFVLFALAVWLIVRGAGGVLKLKAGRPIARPRAWLF